MGMSISERMAMQARAAAASHVKPATAPKQANTVSVASRVAKQAAVTKTGKAGDGMGAPPEAKAPAASMSAAQRIARQGTVAKQNSIAAASVAPPPETRSAPTMSVVERIQNQALTAAAQKHGSVKADVNEQVLAQIRAKYKVFLANLERELPKLDPMFFTSPAAPAEDSTAPAETTADNANGISTAEGEMIVEAPASEPVPGMPYQATPVIKPAQKRRARQKKSGVETA